jgi:antitoxin VapB
VSATAKLFMHGRSQAVRLPKEFRFEGTEVRVSKVGDRVILEPLARSEQEVAAVWAKIDALRGGEDLFPEAGFDDPVAQPDPRKFFEA